MFMTVNVKTQATSIGDAGSLANGSGNELLPIIQQDNNILIDAALLHRKLKAKTRFNDWIAYRIREYGFKEMQDYFTEKSVKQKVGRASINYLLTLDMAKELAMLERSETGRNIRRYFIAKEKELRGLVQLPAGQQLFKGIKPNPINGRRLFPYKPVLERCGYSLKTGGSRRARYPQHFVLVGKQLFITEEFALHLHHQKQVQQNRLRLREMQPVLPFDFGTHPSIPSMDGNKGKGGMA